MNPATDTAFEVGLDGGAAKATIAGAALRTNLGGPFNLRRDEWLLTNGLGGFAMGSVSGIPERRYHAWLVAATQPPVGRVATLMACEEVLVVPGPWEEERYPLSSFRFGGGFIHPAGAGGLVAFEAGLTARWTYEPTPGAVVTRELALLRGQNTCAITYNLEGAPAGSRLEVRPLLAMRDFHATQNREGGDPHFAVHTPSQTAAAVEVRVGTLMLAISCDAPDARFETRRDWWTNFEYLRDRERGQQEIEDLFTPGVFMLEAAAGRVTLLASLVEPDVNNAHNGAIDVGQMVKDEHTRVASLAKAAAAGVLGAPEHLPQGLPAERATLALTVLAQAADQFIVRRRLKGPGAGDLEGKDLSSIIAGYPWFSDWGRDTMISLPGLLLATGRVREAGDTLRAFAHYRRNGLLPNNFDDVSGGASFNTVDAALWFIQACGNYIRAGGDRELFVRHLLPACADIVGAYEKGTEYGIGMDPRDGLIRAGDVGTQLTWMDAKRDGVVFTPRHGKPVEINALWHSGLRTLAELTTDAAEAKRLKGLAARVAVSFASAFWNHRERCLFDVLAPHGDGYEPDAQVRPNQAFAVSLPYCPLSPEQQAGVLDAVRTHLLTPVGLRTLAPGEAGYRPGFVGNLFDRDGAYHNGTVWPWLIGAYAEGVLRVGGFSPAARAQAWGALRPMVGGLLGEPVPECVPSMPPGALLQLAEVFDADAPRRAEGCAAQAWSVGEVLRVLRLVVGPRP